MASSGRVIYDDPMRIVLSDFMSLDGVVQAPGGPDEDTDNGFAHGGWSMAFFDPETMGPMLGAAMDGTDALLFGHRTWTAMAGAWPDRAGDPFADEMNAIKKYVASATLTTADMTWNNSELLPAPTAIESIRKLRESEGGNLLVWGSPNLARQLIGADLVDEYRLMIEPVLLGGGKRLLPDDGVLRTLQLVESSVAATGVLMCVYRPA